MATRHVEITGRPGAITEPQEGSGLHTPEIFGRWPWIGLLLFLIGSIALGVLAYNVYTNGPLLGLDKPLSITLPAIGLHNPALWKPITDAGFLIGGYLIVFIATLWLAYFSSWHKWEEFFILLVAMIGESLLFEIINTLVGRPRPPTQIWNILKIPSFPSGHTEATVVLFSFMAYMLVPKVRSGLGKFLIIFFAIFFMLLVGFSRVFTAGHYFSDVMGGYALGLAWTAIAFTVVERYFVKRRSRNGEKA